MEEEEKEGAIKGMEAEGPSPDFLLLLLRPPELLSAGAPLPRVGPARSPFIEMPLDEEVREARGGLTAELMRWLASDC